MSFPAPRQTAGIILLAAVVLSLPLQAESFSSVQSRISEFTLTNGWKFIVFERHQAPVASFYTWVDAGSAQEQTGSTGLAHMFEHMAFKGTSTIGTKNYAEEKLSLDHVDAAFKALQLERDKLRKADPAKIEQLTKEFKAAQDTAQSFVEANEFGKAVTQAGGRGLNAATGPDNTIYFFDLPSNSLELWFALESERFRDPVFREFYKERDVVMEERRMRTDSNPIGKLVEEMLAAAYVAHPYGEPTVGHASDLQNITRTDAVAFYKTYYQPSNLVSVIVGDVDPKQVKQLAIAYCQRIPSNPKPQPVRVVEPKQTAERRVTLRLNAQRLVLLGYHQPDINDPDHMIYEVISSLLSEGRSSRLYRDLVQEKKLAVQAAGFTSFPGDKYPNLFLFFGLTAPGVTNEALEKAMNQETERLKTELVKKQELDGVKARARSGLLRLFASNLEMAGELAKYQVLTGDWHNLFQILDSLDAVTAQDIQRVSKQLFEAGNRTTGVIEPLEVAEAK